MVPNCHGSQTRMSTISVAISTSDRLGNEESDLRHSYRQEWSPDSKLKDLDFADDIALLDVSVMGMQDLTSKVENAAKLVGLHVNAGKTKMMIMGNLPHGTVTADPKNSASNCVHCVRI